MTTKTWSLLVDISHGKSMCLFKMAIVAGMKTRIKHRVLFFLLLKKELAGAA